MPGAEISAALQAQVRAAAGGPPAAPGEQRPAPLRPDVAAGRPAPGALRSPEPSAAPEESRDVTVDSDAFSTFIAVVKAQPVDSHLAAVISRETGSTQTPHIPTEEELKQGNLSDLLQENRDTLQAITGGQENDQNTQGLIEGMQITLSDEQAKHNARLVELQQEQAQYDGAVMTITTRPVEDKPEVKRIGRTPIPAVTHQEVTGFKIDTQAVPKVVEAEGQIQAAQADLAAKRQKLDNYVKGNPPPPVKETDHIMYRGLAELRRLSHEYQSCDSDDRKREIDARVKVLVADPDLKIPAKRRGDKIEQFEDYVQTVKAEEDDGLKGYLTLRDPYDSAKNALKDAETVKADAEKKSRRWAKDEGGNPARSEADASVGAGFREVDAVEIDLNRVEDNIIRLEVFSAFLSNQYVPSEQNGELKLMGADQSTLRGVDLAIKKLQKLITDSQADPEITALTGPGSQEVGRMITGSTESVAKLNAIKTGLIESLQARFDPISRLQDAKNNVGKIARKILNDRLNRMGITVTPETLSLYLNEVGTAVDSVVGKAQRGETTAQGDPEELYRQIVNVLVGKTVTDSIQPRGQSSDGTPPAAGGAPAAEEPPPSTTEAPAGPNAAAQAEAERIAAETARSDEAAVLGERLGDTISLGDRLEADTALYEVRTNWAKLSEPNRKALGQNLKDFIDIADRNHWTLEQVMAEIAKVTDAKGGAFLRPMVENMWKAGLSSNDKIGLAESYLGEKDKKSQKILGGIAFAVMEFLPAILRDESATEGAGGTPPG